MPPKPPSVPWEFADNTSRSIWKPRPEIRPSDDELKGESPGTADQLESLQARYDEARAAYDEALSSYSHSLEDFRTRLRSYAELCGLAAVFGNQFVSVVITPANQDILPGFAAELSDPMAEAALALAAGQE